jgi:hypothetical protein
MVKSIIYSLMMLSALSSCPLNKKTMTNLEIIKSTYEGKTSEENGKNLAKYVAEDISWTEAKGFPYAGTYIGLHNSYKKKPPKPMILEVCKFMEILTNLFTNHFMQDLKILSK